MNKKPKRRGNATSGQRLAAEYSQLAGARAGLETMASALRTQALIVQQTQQLASQLSPIVAQAVAAQRQQAELAEMFASQLSPIVAQMAAVRRLVASKAGLVEMAQQLASQLSPMAVQAVASQHREAQAQQGLGIAGLVPPTMHSAALTQMFRPLLETPEYKQLGSAAVELSEWAAERIAGEESASPKRFAEIAHRFNGVELDEESKQQFEQLTADDEQVLDAATEFWGLPSLSLENPQNRRAAVLLLRWTSFLLLFVGLLAAPAVTSALLAAGGAAWALGTNGEKGLEKRYSPAARAQIEAMGYRGTGNSRNDQDEI